MIPERLKEILKDGGYKAVEHIHTHEGSNTRTYSGETSNKPIIPVIIKYATERQGKDIIRATKNLRRIGKHPNIVEVYRLLPTEEHAEVMVMERVEGHDLENIVYGQGKLDEKLARHTLYQIANGLGAAHEVGVVHRDVSAKNSILCKDSRQAKVVDFGSSGEPNTQTSSQITPAYASPERGRGESANELSDIYSLGVLGYFMLTRELPFQAGDDIRDHIERAISRRKAQEKPEKIDMQGISNSLRDILLRCMQYRPENRYLSMEEIKKDLEKLEPSVKNIFVVKQTLDPGEKRVIKKIVSGIKSRPWKSHEVSRSLDEVTRLLEAQHQLHKYDMQYTLDGVLMSQIEYADHLVQERINNDYAVIRTFVETTSDQYERAKNKEKLRKEIKDKLSHYMPLVDHWVKVLKNQAFKEIEIGNLEDARKLWNSIKGWSALDDREFESRSGK